LTEWTVVSKITFRSSEFDPGDFSMRSISRWLLTSSLILAAGTASAATLDLTGAIGAAIASGNDDSAIYSGNAAFGDVSIVATPAGSDLSYSAGNGLGIDCRGNSVACLVDRSNQVDNGEVLTISFDRPLFVTSVDLRNLFGTTIGIGSFSVNLEEGGSLVGSNFEIGFDSDNAGAGGQMNVAVARWASSISFVPNAGFLDSFSVAGITIDEFAGSLPAPGANPIPEPSSILLIIAGGAFVLTQLRRKA
jgi:hypothetical protein